MYNHPVNPQSSNWREYESILFRFAFIYFILQVLPLDWKYYKHLFHINWSSLSFRDIFNMAKYTPQFISRSYHPQDWGLATFSDWLFILLLALTGMLIWSLLDKKRTNYQQLYAYLRILVRYRLAIAVIAYGFLKLFDIQAPYPSISALNTPYGDFTTWKIFSLSLGIVPGYQSFLGAVELLAGIFLLFRKTATIGAAIIIFFTGNVFMSNIFYEGGEMVYSFYLVILALFLVAYDAQRIVNLLMLNKPVSPAREVVKRTKQQQAFFIVIKSAIIIVFVIVYGFSAYRSAEKGGYHFSSRSGLKNFSGVYTVSSFQLNNQSLPYSLTDTIRWQNVVFEKWATLSIKINGRDTILNQNTESIPAIQSQNTFEQSGTIGRRYYDYRADTVNHLLWLSNKSLPGRKIQLKYILQPDSTLVLSGSFHGQLVRVVLQKNNKKYLLKAAQNGRRSGLKL